MFHARHLLAAGTLLLAGTALQANDFEGLAAAIKQVWPNHQHLAVVCDYQNPGSFTRVQELAAAAGPGHRVTVFNTPSPTYLGQAAAAAARLQVAALVLIPEDPVAGEGTFSASRLIMHLRHHRVPALGTTPAALAQGALFVVGSMTNGELMVNDKLRGIWEVILPEKAIILRSARTAGAAPIEVVWAQ